jgi:hypothetical protein
MYKRLSDINICIGAFIHDWQADIPTNIMKMTYGLDTCDRVNDYAKLLRLKGHTLKPRINTDREVAK